MDLKAKHLSETCSDPIEFLRQLRQTTEPIGGGTEYSEDGELVEYDVAIEAVKKANDAFIEKVINFLNYKLDDVVATRVSGTIIPHRVVKKDFIEDFSNFIKDCTDTLKVIDPYDACIQYTDRESAIKAHAEVYSWNIESELFQQLTPEQQKLWRKEIEQACISGGYCGLNLLKDSRYDDTTEMKEVDLDYIKEELDKLIGIHKPNGDFGWGTLYNVATHFFKLGLKVQKGENE